MEVGAGVERLADRGVQRHAVEGAQVEGLGAEVEPVGDAGGEGRAEAQQRGVLAGLGRIGLRALELPDEIDGGWNRFMTAWLSVDMMNSLTNGMVNASCDKAAFGWPCDSEVERLRDAYARAPDLASRQKIASELQARAVQYGTHIHLGQYTLPTATRADRPSGVVTSPILVF